MEPRYCSCHPKSSPSSRTAAAILSAASPGRDAPPASGPQQDETLEFDEQPSQLYVVLDKAGSVELLDAIDDAVDILETEPGSAQARRRSFTAGVWGIPVVTRTDNWVVIWEHDDKDQDIIVVRYLGEDPFA